MRRAICLLVIVFVLAAAPARAQIDYARLGQPDMTELQRLFMAEEWESLAGRAEAVARQADAKGDLTASWYAWQILWSAWSNLGRNDAAGRANARSKMAYYQLMKDDPQQGRNALVSYANALAWMGRGDEAVQVVDRTLKDLPADYEGRDLLVFQKAVVQLLARHDAEAAQIMADDAAEQAKRVTSDAPHAAVHRIVAGNEWLWASEMLDSNGLTPDVARGYGKAALDMLAPLARGNHVQVGMRGDLTTLMRAHEAAGNHAEALRRFDEVAGDYFGLRLPRVLERNRYQMAAVRGWWLDRAGQDAAAIASYQAAVESLDRTWSRIRMQENKEAYLGQGWPFWVPSPVRVYERLLHLKLHQGDARGALELAERFKSRAFVDLLRRRTEKIVSRVPPALLAEERRIFKELDRAQKPGATVDPAPLAAQYGQVAERIRAADPHYAELLQPMRQPLARVQALLDADTVLVEYFVGVSESIAWIVTSSDVRAVTLPSGQETIAHRVDAARRVLRRPGSLEAARKGLRPLSDAVLAPILPLLPAKTRRVVVVPHGPLHHVPFAVLLDDHDEYMVRRYAIAQCPSGTALVECVGQNPRRRGHFDVAAASGVAFALGNAQPAMPGWDPLPGTAEEVHLIQQRLPHTRIVEGAAMKAAAVEKAVPAAAFLHFATHGNYNEDVPLDSCLVCVDHELPVPDIFAWRLKAYSVTLSACQSGLGQIQVGDDVVGLSRAFIYAGTPAVISTLWRIADTATAPLMGTFYEKLKSEDRAAALRDAQLSLLGQEETAHPFFWGAFVIQGDWK